MNKFLNKTEELIRKIISCRMLYYIATILLFIGTYYIDLKRKLIEQNMLGMGGHIKYFLIIAAISAIIILILISISKKLYTKLKPHIVYMILALIVGGMYIFFIPLCAQSDEPAHIYRCFEVVQGNIVSEQTKTGEAAKLPKSLENMINVNSENKKREYKKYYDIKEMSKIELNKEETTSIETVISYNGISYIPQVIGVKIGLMLNLNPYYICMLGRITGFIISIGLYTLAIRKMPKHKLFISIVLLSPVVLSYAAAFSIDSIILASTLLLVSYVMHYRETKEKIKKIDYIILAILVIIISISKLAYLPIIGILLFIPKECYKNVKMKYLITSIFMILGVGVVLWWLKKCSINPTVGDTQNTNTWIYTNPLGYLIVLFRTTIASGYSYIENMFAGHFLCHNQVNPYSIVPFTYILIVICAFFTDENKEKTSMIQKIITFGIIILSYALISTSMYIYNTAYNASQIIGVQGRYLVPLLILAILFGNKKILNIEKQKLTNIALIANYVVYLTMMTKFLV